MWTRRRFLTHSLGLGATLAGGDLVLRALSDEGPNGRQALGRITVEAQRAIDGGLAFLAGTNGQSAEDGSFGTNQHRGSVAITSLAALAFMAGGHQPGRGRYGRNVRAAVRFVVDQAQDMHGDCSLLHRGHLPDRKSMYNHGFGTLFLAEVHGMIPERGLRQRVREKLERAVKLIIRTQNPQGGWRYQPQPQEADLSVTICQIMALRAARNAGIAVPAEVATRCTRYVKLCQDLLGDGGFRYMPQVNPTGFARTAAGVVALYSAGIYNDVAVRKGLDYLLTKCKPGAEQLTPQGRLEMTRYYYYGHYYAVQAMWTAGGRYWDQWFPAVREALLNHPDRDRTEGSWYNPFSYCKHYCTAMACIILQVPNNYLPILQR